VIRSQQHRLRGRHLWSSCRHRRVLAQHNGDLPPSRRSGATWAAHKPRCGSAGFLLYPRHRCQRHPAPASW